MLIPWRVYIYIPRAQIISIFEGQPSKTRPFPIKTRGPIWVLGIYVCLHEQLIFMGEYLLYCTWIRLGEQRDVEKEGKVGDSDIAHTTHGTGIFTYILHLP